MRTADLYIPATVRGAGRSAGHPRPHLTVKHPGLSASSTILHDRPSPLGWWAQGRSSWAMGESALSWSPSLPTPYLRI